MYCLRVPAATSAAAEAPVRSPGFRAPSGEETGRFGERLAGWTEEDWDCGAVYDWEVICAGVALGWPPEDAAETLWPEGADWPRWSPISLLLRMGFQQKTVGDSGRIPHPGLSAHPLLAPGGRAYLWVSDGQPRKTHPFLPAFTRAVCAAWDGRRIVVPPLCLPPPGGSAGWELRLVLASPADHDPERRLRQPAPRWPLPRRAG